MAEFDSNGILSFFSPDVCLENSGGKGTNLAKMAREGFPVPPGFIIPTAAYQAFVSMNSLTGVIQEKICGVDPNKIEELESASSQIRAAFKEARLPETIGGQILNEYSVLGRPPVAVRSSATAEDLPDLSFAGQQDTFLNVTTEKMLLQKVVECWASLWTARAIGYRIRQNVPQEDISLAVVVQKMVESEVSGVLFTANPLTGARNELVIDATFGLGEALVSGLVEPDHYVVNKSTHEVIFRVLGEKALSIRPATDGGVTRMTEGAQETQALTDLQILELARLGDAVENSFSSPQDIEWALNKGSFYLVQSRPITSLFPLPDNLPAEPLKTFVSFAAVQGMVDPLTPIGSYTLKEIFADASALFGIHVTAETQTALYSAGERLWVNFTSIIRNDFGRKVLPAIFDLVEPTVKQAFEQIKDDPRLQPDHKGVSFKGRRQLAGFFIPVAGNVFLNILSPARRRKMIVENGEQILQKMENNARAIQGDRYQKLAAQSDLIGDLAKKYLVHAFTLFVSGVASGMVSWNALNMLTGKQNVYTANGMGSRWNELVLEVTRGMPFNPTTEMDLLLWKMSQAIREDEDSVKKLMNTSAEELASKYLQGNLSGIITEEVDRFLNFYGGRGLCEIDLGRTRWVEDPTHVFEMLNSFLKIQNPEEAPDAVFSRGARAAEAAVDQLAAQVREKPKGRIKSNLVRFFAGRTRQLMGLRENPKFFAVRMMWVLHRELKRTGQEFVEAGELNAADDLFFLTTPELKAMAAREKKDWRSLVGERRMAFDRELKRKQLPRMLLSDGRAFFEGMSGSGNGDNKSITGSPVSPGFIEGFVRVVRDPGKAGLQPGEIMVCPGTDPSWTPLFLIAGGLVMEVGGMMTHGAVVAREYGIPAVVGVHQATTRLVTGMRIRLDGSSGEILILEPEAK